MHYLSRISSQLTAFEKEFSYRKHMTLFRSQREANQSDSFQPIPGLGSGVEVRRSARRKRTISAHREGANVVISIPANMSKREESEAVREMVERMNKHDLKKKISDEDLAVRAIALNSQFFEGSATPRSVRWVSNMRERWGSCTPEDGSIRISDRVRLMPEYVLDYVLVHELAHLIEIGHNPAFYELENRYPDRLRAEAYLEGWIAGHGHGESS